MSTMEFVSNLITDIISLQWLIFLVWFIRHFRKEISSLFEVLKARMSKVEIGPLAVEFEQEAQDITVSGISKAVEQALLSGSLEDRSKAAKEDLPKLSAALSPGHRVVGPIEAEAIRKLRLVCDDIKDTSEWIDDYIFVSGTYGYGVGPAESSIMARKGWIEISGSKVRITEEGRRFAKSL